MSSIHLLLLALATLPAGALLGRLLANKCWGIQLLEGLTAGFLGALLLFHLLPASLERLGPAALLGIAAGLVFIALLERLGPHEHHRDGSSLPAEMIWLGLLLHQLHDGFALALASRSVTGDSSLALAVVLHRLPVAAIVFHLYVRQGRSGAAWLRLGAMGLATAVGMFFSGILARGPAAGFIDWFYVFSVGSFLHLLGHDFLHSGRAPRKGRVLALATIMGGALFLAAHTLAPSHEHHNDHHHETHHTDHHH